MFRPNHRIPSPCLPSIVLSATYRSQSQTQTFHILGSLCSTLPVQKKKIRKIGKRRQTKCSETACKWFLAYKLCRWEEQIVSAKNRRRKVAKSAAAASSRANKLQFISTWVLVSDGSIWLLFVVFPLFYSKGFVKLSGKSNIMHEKNLKYELAICFL